MALRSTGMPISQIKESIPFRNGNNSYYVTKKHIVNETMMYWKH